MCILSIARAVKRCHSMKSKPLNLEAIINELDFLRKIVIIQ